LADLGRARHPAWQSSARSIHVEAADQQVAPERGG